MRKAVLVICIAVLAIVVAGLAYAADAPKQAVKPAAVAVKAPAGRPMMPQMDKNFAFVAGSITKIDTADPNNVKLEMVNEPDGKTHVIEVGTNTNVLKVIEPAELKAGEKVRVMARKMDNKEVAMSVVTGKIKEMPRPRPMPARQATPPAAPAAPATTKK